MHTLKGQRVSCLSFPIILFHFRFPFSIPGSTVFFKFPSSKLPLFQQSSPSRLTITFSFSACSGAALEFMPDVELMRDRFVVITRLVLVVVAMVKGWKTGGPLAWPRHTLHAPELRKRERKKDRERIDIGDSREKESREGIEAQSHAASQAFRQRWRRK